MEQLEDRTAPAVITVTGNGDTIALDTFATLREAITSINNQADVNADVTVNRVGLYASQAGGTPDAINFNMAGGGVQVIAVTGSPEPTIVSPLTINGYSQTGASANTLVNADNAVILIQLDGAGAGAGSNGLTLGAGSAGSTIRGLDITNFAGNGIVIQSNGNAIVGNFVGVDPTGATRMPNGTFPNSGDGILIQNASNNQIGSTDPAARNIASGNAIDGIHIVGTLASPATGNIIQGNFVGVAADGRSSVGNRTEPAPAPGTPEGNNLFGIEISGGNLNTVGGTAAGARNVVGFNGAGIEVDNGGQQNIIQGNFSGVGADGITPVGNLLHGIVLRSSNGFGPPFGPAQPNEPGVSFNNIGGTAAGAGNVVAFNGTGGIAIFGNPVSASGQPNVGNSILGNSVYRNGRSFMTASSAPLPLLGIDLSNEFLFPRDDGLTPNDSKGHGAANDPNNFQNFPVLTFAESGNNGTQIIGTLHSDPNKTYRIEFFASDPDPLNLPAEGQQFLGFINTTTDAGGNASFNTVLPVPIAAGRVATATATDPVGNTSEFSAGINIAKLVPLIAVGSRAGRRATVIVANTDGTARFQLAPYGGFTGGVSVAAGDFNGDGVADVVTGQGPGAVGGRVKVFDGNNGHLLHSFFTYPGFAGGVRVAVGDVNGDHIQDIIVAAGSGQRVKVIDGAKLNQVQANGAIANSALLASFFAYLPGFTGGVFVAAGDVNGDGKADIVTSPGGGSPRVKVIDAAKLDQKLPDGRIASSAFLGSFLAYVPAFHGGVFVGAGDVNGDGKADVFTGPGAGSPRVKVVDATKLHQLLPDGRIDVAALHNNFLAFARTFHGGVAVAASDVNGDGLPDIIAGAGPGAGPQVRVFRGTDSALLRSSVAFPGFTGGVYVAGSAEPIGIDAQNALASTINDLYLFRSPANAANTVFIMTFQPFAGALTPATADPNLTYEIHIDVSGDAQADVVFQVAYGAPDANGVQSVTLRGLPSANFPPNGILAQGFTGQNVPTTIPGGLFRSGIQDEPGFFDAGAFNNYLAAGDKTKFPRPVGQAKDFYGPNGNTFAIVLEIPSNTLTFPVNNPNKVMGVWATINKNGAQLSRMGRPLIETALIPPVPRNNLSHGDRLDDFATSDPANDRLNDPAGFRDDMIAVLTDPNGLYHRSATDAAFLADALLPDLVFFQIGNPGGFGTLVGGAGSPGIFGTGPFAGGQVLGNGRQMRDDVVDIDFNLLTNGAIPSDNVGDDNGLRVTDGSIDPVSNKQRAIAFPYIGAANQPLNGPGTLPNP